MSDALTLQPLKKTMGSLSSLMNPWIKHGKVVINRINHGYDTMVIFKASLVSGDFEEIRPWAEESGDVQIADLGTAKARNR